jgi:acyl carrier protein
MYGPSRTRSAAWAGSPLQSASQPTVVSSLHSPFYQTDTAGLDMRGAEPPPCPCRCADTPHDLGSRESNAMLAKDGGEQLSGHTVGSERGAAPAELMARVLEQLQAAAGMAPGVAITPGSLLREELGFDSLRTVDFIIEIEDAFGISIETDELNDVRSVGDIVRLIASKQAAGSK